PVLDQDAGVGQPVHQRRLARVRVAHERHRRERDALALVAVESPRAIDLVQTLAEDRDALADAAAVDLELRLTGTARADAAAEAREVGPLSGEAGREILELGELDLQLALEAPRPLREDVEDERAPIDDLAVR